MYVIRSKLNGYANLADSQLYEVIFPNFGNGIMDELHSGA